MTIVSRLVLFNFLFNSARIQHENTKDMRDTWNFGKLLAYNSLTHTFDMPCVEIFTHVVSIFMANSCSL